MPKFHSPYLAVEFDVTPEMLSAARHDPDFPAKVTYARLMRHIRDQLGVAYACIELGSNYPENRIDINIERFSSENDVTPDMVSEALLDLVSRKFSATLSPDGKTIHIFME